MACRYNVTVPYLLLLFISSVQSHCKVGGTCDDADTMLRDIAADPKSYQQLLQAFYPINKAQPAYMVVAYFINFTGTFPKECDGHTYPWTTFPNFTSTHIQWYLWSTLPANNLVSIQLMTDFGLSVPAQSYYALFNTAPWWLKVTTSIACVALPYNTAEHVKNRVTVEVRAHTVDAVLVCDVGMSSTISIYFGADAEYNRIIILRIICLSLPPLPAHECGVS